LSIKITRVGMERRMDKCIDCGISLANYGYIHKGEGPLCHLCLKKRGGVLPYKLNGVQEAVVRE